MKRKESGITLLALVVTIIVMLILAGVALKLGIGDNGIIGIAGNTVDLYTNASEQEQEGLNRFTDEFNQILNEGRPGGEDNTDENITIDTRPTISIVGWNQGVGGIVEISPLAGCTIQYKIGRTGQWIEYSGQVNVDNGDTIFARYKNEEGVSASSSKIVEDTTGPNVNITSLTVDGGEISIMVTAQDNEMGMPNPPTYNYYIKLHSDTYYESVGHNTTGEFTFTELKGNEQYDIRVSTTDLAGNQGSTTSNSQTGETVEIPTLVVDENIFFDLSPEGPTTGPVNVTIRVEPELEKPLYLEYSTDGNKWEKYEKPVEMTDNGRVYAKVNDGEGNTSNVVYVDVTNIDRTKPEASVQVTNTTSKSITVSVTPTVGTDLTYEYYIKAEGENDYRRDNKDNDKNATHIFEKLDDDTNYDIIVTFTTAIGNSGEATTTAKTLLVPGLNEDNTTFKLYTTNEEGAQEEFPADKVTNKPLMLEITVDSETKGSYKVQYSTDGTNYQEYTDKIQITDKTTVHVRLWDERDTNENHGTEVTKEITNVDASLSDLGVLVKNEEQVKENTKVTDKDGNTITIPEGFTPQPNPDADPGSDPNGYYDPEIEDGVIVKDAKGNEFVWIPVGTINTDNGPRTIVYNRYIYSNWKNGGTDSETNSMKIQTTADQTEYFAESLNESEKNSAVNNGGFYLGRYEAGVSGGTARTEDSGTSQTVEIKPNLDVYNYVTQSEARALAEGMYSSANYTSSLPSSYAWDTAIKFLEQTGNEAYLTDSSQGNYYNTMPEGKTEEGSVLIETGKTTPVNHLYDMGGNVYEWTTERYSNSEATKVSRGGFYGFLSTDEPVIGRFSSSNTADQAISFRVALFLGAVDDQVKYMDDLQIGDYVAYSPGSETASSYPLSMAESGYTSDQTISRDSLNWRVLSINDDGTVNLVSDTTTSQTIGFGNAVGYNNGVFLLNDIASSLYSNSSLGATARSINIEDVEKGMTTEGLEFAHENTGGRVPWRQIERYSLESLIGPILYPNLYAEENGSGINFDVLKTDGIDQSDGFFVEEPSTEIPAYSRAYALIVTQTFYFFDAYISDFKNTTFRDMLFNPEYNNWIASRYVQIGDAFPGFGIFYQSDGIMGGRDGAEGGVLFSIVSTEGAIQSKTLRPIISLNANIKLISGDGKSASTAYQIQQ